MSEEETQTEQASETPRQPVWRRAYTIAGIMLALMIAAALIYLPMSPLVQNAYDSEGTSAPIHGQAALWLRIGFWGLVLMLGAALFWLDRQSADADE